LLLVDPATIREMLIFIVHSTMFRSLCTYKRWHIFKNAHACIPLDDDRYCRKYCTATSPSFDLKECFELSSKISQARMLINVQLPKVQLDKVGQKASGRSLSAGVQVSIGTKNQCDSGMHEQQGSLHGRTLAMQICN
jgi:hypothetical protein